MDTDDEELGYQSETDIDMSFGSMSLHSDSEEEVINSATNLDDPDDTQETWGLRWTCPLNKLSSFHAVDSLPPDFMHDWMEGVLPCDLLSILRVLEKEKVFSIKHYNEVLKNLSMSTSEKKDKPSAVPMAKNLKRLKGKAVSQWVKL